MSNLSAFLRSFVPALTPVSNQERLRAALGALVGIAVTGFFTTWLLGGSADLPLLIAPMGASSVLLFAVPASPLAQPWSIIGGNLVAATVGVSAWMLVGEVTLAAALAAGVSIALMLVFRCLHPPSGAVALTAVLGGPSVHALGFGFVLTPVLVNSLALLAVALAFNNLTGRRYPHRAPAPAPAAHATADAPPSTRLGFAEGDLDAALRDYNQLLDIDTGDLATVLRQAQLRAYLRRSGEVRCADIMSRDVVTIAPQVRLKEALRTMRRHDIKALPVVANGRVVGMLTQTDFLEKPAWGEHGPIATLGQALRRSLRTVGPLRTRVADIMTTPVRSALPETPVADLVPLLSDGGLHHLPIIDRDGRLVGIITQSDVIGALFSGLPAMEARATAAVPA
jgi:CBS domain-containing membrane protein